MSARQVQGGGRGASGVSIAALVTVIVIFLVCLTVAYSFYLSKEMVRREVTDRRAELAQREQDVRSVFATRQQTKAFLDGHGTGDEVKSFLTGENLANRALPTDDPTFKEVLDALDVWVFRYERARSQLKLAVTSAQIASRSNAEAVEVDREAFSRLAQQKKRHLVDLDRFLAAEVKRKEDNVNKYNEEREGFGTEYSVLKEEYDAKKGDLLNRTATNRERTKVVRREMEFLKPGPVLRGPDGQVTVSDWRIHKAVVDLGKIDGVFAGLVLSVYLTNDQGKQEVKGRLKVMTVEKDSCTCNVVEESKSLPIIAGDLIHVPLIPIPAKKRFVVAGPFGPEAAYSAEQLIGLIKLNGGIIQDRVDLFTDYLVRGETGVMVGVTETVEQADEAASARAEVQVAKELSVTTVDYLDFISYIRQ